MFRELLRKNKRIPDSECIEILMREKRGVLSVLGDGGYPYGMPMNHFYNPDDGCIYFHCGKKGHRLDSLRRCDKVSFCVYDEGYAENGDWALNINSVIVFGRVKIIENRETVRAVTERLCHKFTQDEEYIQKEIAAALGATLLLKLTPEHICGKRIKES